MNGPSQVLSEYLVVGEATNSVAIEYHCVLTQSAPDTVSNSIYALVSSCVWSKTVGSLPHSALHYPTDWRRIKHHHNKTSKPYQLVS